MEKKRKIGKLIFQQSACIIADRKFRVTIRSPDRETMASWEVNTLLYLRSHRGRARCRERVGVRQREKEAERSRGKREVSSAVFLVKRAVDTSHTRILLPVFPEEGSERHRGTPGIKLLPIQVYTRPAFPETGSFRCERLSLGVRVEHEVKSVLKRRNAGRVQVKMQHFNYG